MLNLIVKSIDTVAVRQRELDAVMQLARRDMADSLAEVAAFESALADFFSFPAGVTTSSETGALSVMAGAMGLKPGDEILISPDVSSWIIVALVHYGLSLKLIDYAPGRLHIDAAKLKESVTERSRLVILSSHFVCAEAQTLLQDICREKSLLTAFEITPSCFADPYRRGRVAGFDIALLSLREGCNAVSTGEGGAILYRHKDRAEKAKSYSQFSDLDGVHLGVNHKLSGIQCALGQVRLDVLAQISTAVPDEWKRYREWCERVNVPVYALPEGFLPPGVIVDKRAAEAHNMLCLPLPVLTGIPASFLPDAPEAEQMRQKWTFLALAGGVAA